MLEVHHYIQGRYEIEIKSVTLISSSSDDSKTLLMSADE